MRIGINISDELIRNLEPIKAFTNISQICRQAIKDRVEVFQRADARAQSDGMDVAAARLIAEHKTQAVDWEAMALEDAKLWVQLASMKDFDDLFHNLRIKESKGRIDNWIPTNGYLSGSKTFVDRQYENQDWFYRQVEMDESINHIQVAETHYTGSWLSYVTAVWQMAKDGIAAEVKEREETLANAKSEMAMPTHLKNATENRPN
jgi:metal-responsive CopG/Arc/MetJ family transcriptional regulator